ncbi:hypothetical protein [Halpernia sp.]|uniref:hypothetical protein n=1 Tax=Halpernia sp. TaxID=2782209 RepID=UPI003A903CF2
MATIEIKEDISQDKIRMVVNVLKALGITAVFKEQKDNTKLSKKEFTDKIERARKSPKTKVSASEQTKILGL